MLTNANILGAIKWTVIAACGSFLSVFHAEIKETFTSKVEGRFCTLSFLQTTLENVCFPSAFHSSVNNINLVSLQFDLFTSVAVLKRGNKKGLCLHKHYFLPIHAAWSNFSFPFGPNERNSLSYNVFAMKIVFNQNMLCTLHHYCGKIVLLFSKDVLDECET